MIVLLEFLFSVLAFGSEQGAYLLFC